MDRSRLKDIDVGCFLSYGYQTLSFGEATFLVGRNGAGKSNLARAVWMLGRAVREPLTIMLGERGGFSSFRHALSNNIEGQSGQVRLFSRLLLASQSISEYGFVLLPTEPGFVVLREYALCNGLSIRRYLDGWRESIPDFAPLVNGDALALPVVASKPEFAPLTDALDSIRLVDIVPDRLRDYQNSGNGLTFGPDGSNGASVLREMIRNYPDRHARLLEFLGVAVPGIVDVRPKTVGNKLTLEFTQSLTKESRLSFEATNMSDGTLRIFGILLALLQSPSPMMLVIEEPEAAIHPGALAVLLDAMKEAKERMQLLVTTQSPEILDAEWITEDDVRIVDWQNGFSRISPLASGAREMLRSHLFTAGELLRSNALVGEPAAL